MSFACRQSATLFWIALIAPIVMVGAAFLTVRHSPRLHIGGSTMTMRNGSITAAMLAARVTQRRGKSRRITSSSWKSRGPIAPASFGVGTSFARTNCHSKRRPSWSTTRCI